MAGVTRRLKLLKMLRARRAPFQPASPIIESCAGCAPFLKLPGIPMIPKCFALTLLSVLAFGLNGCSKKEGASASPTQAKGISSPTGKPVIAMLPKLINIDYFDACKRGAEKTAAELGVTLIYDGPTEPSGSEQNNFFDTWI